MFDIFNAICFCFIAATKGKGHKKQKEEKKTDQETEDKKQRKVWYKQVWESFKKTWDQ